MDRSDMNYINPGKRDHAYVGKPEGKSQYVQKQYLLWKLIDVLYIIVSGNEIVGFQDYKLTFQDRFEKKLSFSNLCNFFKSHKQYI